MKPCKTLNLLLLLFLSLFLIQCAVKDSGGSEPGDSNPGTDPETPSQPVLQLIKATGNLRVETLSSTDTYEIYFHIPIAFEDQVPVSLRIESEDLLHYRFLRLAPPNVIVAATMQKSASAEINWEGWVLIRRIKDASLEMPSYIQLPTREQLPENTRKWLRSTSCVQVDAPVVQEKALLVKDNTDNLRILSNSIARYCKNEIPWRFPHKPMGFSAVYALKWGNSCTGHAHAGAALFRANGVPSRVLLNILTDYPSPMDMHWVIDYYIPGYNWHKMETSQDIDLLSPDRVVVVMVCEPEAENPLFYPNGIDSYWYSSDPAVGIPQWGKGHLSESGPRYSLPENDIEELYSLSLSVWERFVDARGIHLSDTHQNNLDTAYAFQQAALSHLQSESVDNGKAALRDALENLETIQLNPIQTIYFDDFENGVNGWTHGGTGDEWELGVPAYISDNTFTAYSGNNCWGTDLDNTYENNADNWLMSPVFNLESLSCAYLSVYIRNSLEGDDYHRTYDDPLWLEITADGQTFLPLCTYMGGLNDDPEIYDKGGWSFLALDLFRYIGEKVQIRFRMRSDADQAYEGVHIDDFRVYGRMK
ncbi:MAG: choice-of-anchor J domain-containing protein [Candidatus Aminicenantes bacterium]|nr:MAG: choice-of-anchor J domain-containing protein [Candidatus Aminicenantes bacterium]